MTSHDNENLHTWITEGYTIESYLMDEFINLNFDVESNNRIKLKSGKNKVQIAKDYIEKGQLVPDELIINMLAKVLDGKKESKGVIFDGFPRTIPQAKALKVMLNERGTDV